MRVGGREVRYTPYQAPKMELFVEIVNGCFRKNVHFIFEICLKGFWIRLCITWKHKQSKESGSNKNYNENVCDEGRFYWRWWQDLKIPKIIWTENKSFSIAADLFYKKCLRSIRFNFRYSVERQTDRNVSVRDKPNNWGKIHL